MDVTVLENPDTHRYEAVDGTGTVVGFVEYVDHRDTRLLFHAEVDPSSEGQGIGSTLAREVLDQAVATGRDSGLAVRVTCPFIVKWLEEHPDYADKVTVG